MKNYVSTENSLKRFLKKKVKITMGMVVAFMITGTVGFGADFLQKEAALHINTKTDPINDLNYSLNTETSEISNQVKNGILIDVGETLNINSENIAINHKVLNNTNDYGWTRSALDIQKSGILKLGNFNTKNISIVSTTDKDIAVGMKVWRNNGQDSGKVEIQSENLNIKAISSDYFAYGMFIYNNTTPDDIGDKGRAEVIINSKNVSIEAEGKEKGVGYSNGIIAWSQGIAKINNGNVSITADNVINTRGDSLVEINANNNSQNTVKLNGNIIFAYNGESSGTPIESDIKINLSNSDSKFTGSVYKVIERNFPDNKTEDQKKELLSVSSMELGLSNGATWEVTEDSFINKLELNNGVINIKKSTEEIKEETILDEDLQVNDGRTTVNIDNIKGNGGTVTFETKINGKELKVTEGNLRIREEAAKGTNLEVGLSGVNTDDLAEKNISVEKALKELTNKVVGKDGANIENIDQTLFVDGGTLTGKVTADLENGKVTNIQQAKDTPTTAAIRDLTAINYLSWKQEMSSLSQRMGELRDSSAEHGVWARVYGGKVENGSQYDNKYQTYQVGYDKKYTVDNGRVYLGYLVSYTDGETDYSYGTGENYSVGAGIYATWMNNNGHYVDVLYKVSRLNNKFDMKDVEDVKGDYDTYGISLSAEYGKRFDITEKWFAEPSVGMHLGRLGDETYTTDGGIEVSQDSIYTAEGRVGAAVGYKFSDKGNVYARTHVVKEFAGDVDTEYERNGVYASTSEDFGDTWFEFGVGANYRFTENMNVYAYIERTGDSTVETKWQGNLGFRYEF